MPKISKKEYAKQQREEQRKLLEDAVSKLMTSEGWQEYLNTRAKFYRYSFFNTILINLQRPDATKVGGAKNLWMKEFGRRIKAEEWRKPIKILAPVIIYEKDKDGKFVLDGEGKKQIRMVWYRTVKVYDVTQTEGDPLPEMPLEPIDGMSHEEYLYRARQFAEGEGITVKPGYMTGEGQDAYGHYSALDNTLHINDTVAINAQVRAMIQGLAKGLASKMEGFFDYTVPEREVIVESAAYLACRSVGLDTAGLSIPFIASFLEDGDTVKLMKAFASKVDELASTIEEGIS